MFILRFLNWIWGNLEQIYFIAFILLTALIVIYARKTYKDQIKQVSNLFLKLSIPVNHLDHYDQLICLEIYNHGTRPAQNVKIFIGENELAVIDFIAPNGTASIPVGHIMRTIGCNHVYIQKSEISANESIQLSVSESGANKNYDVNTSALFIHSEVIHEDEHEIVNALKRLARN